ncbi:MAG: VOC family protein [Bacteroidetes bacterium]|jgi:catechol 2,3-dioxygenase-like lactoylglutathione lyase family enzyme|nr:VOC family protein [Bacteroidota bacterium]
MLTHIALTVNEPEDINNFFKKILLFSLKKKFSINSETAMYFFNHKKAADVYLMDHDGTQFEIFHSKGKETKVFSHICLSYSKAEAIYKKAVESNYKVLIKRNPVNDTYFISDKSGNVFEIKEIQE